VKSTRSESLTLPLADIPQYEIEAIDELLLGTEGEVLDLVRRQSQPGELTAGYPQSVIAERYFTYDVKTVVGGGRGIDDVILGVE